MLAHACPSYGGEGPSVPFPWHQGHQGRREEGAFPTAHYRLEKEGRPSWDGDEEVGDTGLGLDLEGEEEVAPEGTYPPYHEEEEEGSGLDLGHACLQPLHQEEEALEGSPSHQGEEGACHADGGGEEEEGNDGGEDDEDPACLDQEGHGGRLGSHRMEGEEDDGHHRGNEGEGDGREDDDEEDAGK